MIYNVHKTINKNRYFQFVSIFCSTFFSVRLFTTAVLVKPDLRLFSTYRTLWGGTAWNMSGPFSRRHIQYLINWRISWRIIWRWWSNRRTIIVAHKNQLKMAHTPIRTSRLQLPEATRRKRSRSESDEIVFQGCSDSDDEPFLGFPEQRNTNPTRTKRTKTSDNPTNDSLMSDSLIMTRSRARKIKK